MASPTGDQQQAPDQTVQHVSIPPANAVVEQSPGAPLTLDEDDVSDAQLAQMQSAFFAQGPAPVPAQPQAPVQQYQQPAPAAHEFPMVRYRPQSQEEFNALTQAKASGVSVMDLIFGAPASAPVAAAAPAAAPVAPAIPTPAPVEAVAAPAVPVSAAPVVPATPVPDADVAAAKAALDAAIAEDIEVKRIAAEEPWNASGPEFHARQAQATVALSEAATKKALAEHSAVARTAAAAAAAEQAQQAAADAYVANQFQQITAQIPQWASQDQNDPFVRARDQAYQDLLAAKDPLLNTQDWQRHLLTVVLARTGGVPTSAPVQPANVAVFNPPAYAGMGAPVHQVPMNADQMEEADLAADQYDPYGLNYGQRRIRVS